MPDACWGRPASRHRASTLHDLPCGSEESDDKMNESWGAAACTRRADVAVVSADGRGRILRFNWILRCAGAGCWSLRGHGPLVSISIDIGLRPSKEEDVRSSRYFS